MLTKSVGAAATAAVVLLVTTSSPAIVAAGPRDVSPELQNHRRKLWDIAERNKMLADPRGLHRERLRQEGDAKIRERGIYIHPDYHQLRRQIDVHAKQFYPNKIKQQKLEETKKTEEERKTDEEVAFWERLLGDPHSGHMEFSITASPTKAPTPVTPAPSRSEPVELSKLCRVCSYSLHIDEVTSNSRVRSFLLCLLCPSLLINISSTPNF